MSEIISAERKQELCRILAANLPTLRTKVNMSQNELADRLGFTRQTISAIEGEKREMQWSTFTALVLFFSSDEEMKQLMSIFGIWGNDIELVLNVKG